MPTASSVRRRRTVSAHVTLALGVALTATVPALRPEFARAAAVAVGTNGVTMTSSTVGLTWNAPVIPNASVSIAGVWFSTPTNGVCVGNGNAIFRSVNGGGSWSPVSSPITTTYNDVMFPTSTTGFIACTSGQVLKSTDSGASWSAQSTGSPGGLVGIHFVNANQGCAVGASGAIVRTTNGGTNWTNESTGSANLNDVFFFDTNNGWAVGAGGTILRSTNGGDTWTAVTSGTTVDLTAVWFTSATLGFVCGGDRVLRTTTNGGTSWSAVTLPATSQLSGLFDLMFADPDTGIVVGSGVNAYRTLNGGATWEVANPDPTNEVLQAVHLSRPPGPPPQITVTVNSVPAGRSFTVDGTTYTSQQQFQWESGSVHQVSTTDPQTISATERYDFTAWSGGSTSTSTSITVSPTSNTTYTANFQRQFLLTMTNVAGGTTTPAEGTSWRNAGSSVAINATDGTGYDFVAWAGTGSGSYTGTTRSTSITMNGAITQTADFDPVAITLTFQTNPAGRQVIVDGTTRTTPYVLATTADEPHTINVPSPQGESGGMRLAYLSWSDGGAQSHTIDPLVNTTYTANLKTQYFLDMSVDPAGSGAAVPGDSWHDAGTRPTLSATPNPGYFVYFHQGSGTGSYDGFPGADARPQMDGPIAQTVHLSNATPRNVTVQGSPPGPNLIVGNVDIGTGKAFTWPDGVGLPLTAPATQTAVANVKRWQWTHWSDGGARAHIATPSASLNKFTAFFDVQFELEMQAETGGTTNPPPGESWVDSNTVVQITALPDSNHTFQSWSGTGSSSYSGSNNPASFTLRGRVNELARFDLLPRLILDDLTSEERRFVALEPETIRWTANYASTTHARVEYKHTIAATWLLAGTATPQTGFLVWTPPDAPQSSLQMRLVSTSPNVIGDTLSGTFQICDPYFNPGPAIASLAADSAPTDVVPVDYDGDGVLDLVAATAQGLTYRLGLASPPGTGSGGFGPPATSTNGGGLDRLAVFDWDGDGDPDVVGSQRTGSFTYSLYRCGTNGTAGPYAWHSTAGLGAVGRPNDLAWGDVDEDGVMDLVALSTSAAKLFVLRGTSSNGVPAGGFQFLAEAATLSNASRIRLADLDLDGRLDVVVLAGSPSRLAVQFGVPGPPATFAAPEMLGLAALPADVALADFDEDGAFDAAWSAPTAGGLFVTPRIGREGPGGANFGALDTVATGAFFTRVAPADFDRDGHADVVVVDPGLDRTSIFRGRGDGTFEFLTSRAAGEGSHAVVQDFLEDGRSDLLLVGPTGGTTLFAGDLASCGFGGSTVFLDEPNAAGLTFTVGQEATIRWRPFGGGVVLADLDVSRDNGTTWLPIARGIVQRTYAWTVTPPATTQGRIRVRSSTGFLTSDVSTNPFTVVAGAVDVPGDPGAIPAVAAFAAPVPNPARGTVRLALDLPTETRVTVVLYDVTGRRVRTLHDGDMPAGSHAITWDGRDDAGRSTGAGVYLARARWTGFEADRRLIRLGP